MMMSSALTCSGWCQDLCSQSKGSYTNVLGMAIEYKRPGGGGGGGYFLVKGYWGCAAGWGRIFTTGLTIIGLHF